MYIETNTLISNGNIRSGNKKKEASYKRLKENIKGTGAILQAITAYNIGDPLLEDDTKLVILDGHQRHSIAKELGMKEVPVHVIDAPNGSTELFQYSTNTYRVEMTLYEEIKFYTNLVEQEDGMKAKQIAEKFGHSVQYVKERLQLGNLHPDLLFPEMKPGNKENLLAISTFDLTLQDNAIDTYCEYNDVDRKEFAVDLREDDESDWNAITEVRSILRRKTPSLEDFSLFSEKEITEYKKSYTGPLQTSLELFDDIEWTTEEFLQHCYVTKYKDIYDILESFPTVENSWQLESVDIEKLASYKNPAKTIASRYTAWGGDITNLRFARKPKKDDTEDAVVEEKGKYYGQLKKFHKVVAPLVLRHISSKIDPDMVMDGKNGQLSTFIWMTDFGKWMHVWRDDKFANMTIEETFRCLNRSWYKNNAIDSTFTELDVLLSYQNEVSIQDTIVEEYATNEEFRVSVNSCFTLKVLNESFKTAIKKKKDLIDSVSVHTTKFPFMDIFQKKNNEWRNIPLSRGTDT
jgi:ParB/RepB/Spo0J family partition protein|tara:strand:- start:3238 stop:4794 length:1557 start_codon:yes stop_codon:yes gene_type:complete